MFTQKNVLVFVLLVIVSVLIGCLVLNISTRGGKFVIVLQAGKETHEGTARAVHALLYATELKEAGYEVVLIFDGAGTEWAEELSNPDSKSKILPSYQSFKKKGISEVVCDFCASAFGVKEKLGSRQSIIASEYQGHPSIAKWIKKGYQLIVL